MHRYFKSASTRPIGGWQVPLNGLNPAPTFASLIQQVKSLQGSAYIGDDAVARLICERDPAFCYSYVFESKPPSTPLAKGSVPIRRGCSSCAARAQAKNGGTIR